MVAIRRAAPADLDALMRLADATPEAPHWDRTAYEAFLPEPKPLPAPPTLLLIAHTGKEIAGFAAARVTVDVCELESIIVAPSFRRSGLGARLLATIIEWARKHDAARLQLEVRSGNHSAIAFYHAAGFCDDGLRRDYYTHPDEHALLMSLPLAP